MKVSTTTLATVIACTTAVSAAPATYESSVQKRADIDQLAEALRELQSFNEKRDTLSIHLEKREYEIVTKVLASLNDTGMAPKVIHYLATNEKLQPVVVKTLVAVIKAGAMNLTGLFKALDESNLVTKVVNDLISDCQLYVSLFDVAKKIIANLEKKVESLVKEGISKLSQRDLEVIQHQKRSSSQLQPAAEFDKRDFNDVVVNLLDSLGESGLASSVVKSIATDPSYLPFAIDLVKEVMASGALSVSQLISAVKGSNLVGNLLEQILTVDTFKTVATNAFAAFFGDCPGATSVISVDGATSTSSSGSSGSDSNSGSGSGSGSSSGSTSGKGTTANPCKKKRRRRSYNY